MKAFSRKVPWLDVADGSTGADTGEIYLVLPRLLSVSHASEFEDKAQPNGKQES